MVRSPPPPPKIARYVLPPPLRIPNFGAINEGFQIDFLAVPRLINVTVAAVGRIPRELIKVL